MADTETAVTVGQAQDNAASAVAEAAAIASEDANATVAAVVEMAAEAVDEAQETAAAIARAAMETELGRRIYAIEERIAPWLGVDLAALQSQLATLQETVNTLQGQMAATATLAVVAVTEPTTSAAPVSSTPQASDKIAEAVAETTAIIPDNLAPDESTPAEPVAPKAKRRLFL